jgi:hypothetical protein
MMIKDLEMSKELAGEELSEVRGGANTLVQISEQNAPVSVAGGGVFSPQIVTSAPVNTQVGQIVDNDLTLNLNNKLANVVGSLDTYILQP